MLEIPTSPGKPPMIAGEALEKLKTRLAEPIGFESYGAIQQWLLDECGSYIQQAS